MKRFLTGSCAVALMLTFSMNVNATKWRTYGTASYGDCEISYQFCDRVFLSTDGCTPDDVRAIYDPFNQDCNELIVNGALMVE